MASAPAITTEDQAVVDRLNKFWREDKFVSPISVSGVSATFDEKCLKDFFGEQSIPSIVEDSLTLSLPQLLSYVGAFWKFYLTGAAPKTSNGDEVHIADIVLGLLSNWQVGSAEQSKYAEFLSTHPETKALYKLPEVSLPACPDLKQVDLKNYVIPTIEKTTTTTAVVPENVRNELSPLIEEEEKPEFRSEDYTSFVTFIWELINKALCSPSLGVKGKQPDASAARTQVDAIVDLALWVALVMTRSIIKEVKTVREFMEGSRFQVNVRKMAPICGMRKVPPPHKDAIQSIFTSMDKSTVPGKRFLIVELGMALCFPKNSEQLSFFKSANLTHFSYNGMGLYKSALLLSAETRTPLSDVFRYSLYTWSKSHILSITESFSKLGFKDDTDAAKMFEWARVINTRCFLELADQANTNLLKLWCGALKRMSNKYDNVFDKKVFRGQGLTEAQQRWVDKFVTLTAPSLTKGLDQRTICIEEESLVTQPVSSPVFDDTDLYASQA